MSQGHERKQDTSISAIARNESTVTYQKTAQTPNEEKKGKAAVTQNVGEKKQEKKQDKKKSSEKGEKFFTMAALLNYLAST